MMIRLLSCRVGPSGLFNEGDVLDIPDAEAKRMIATRQAEPIGPETAMAKPRGEARNDPTQPKRKKP